MSNRSNVIRFLSNLDQYNQTDIDSYPPSDFRVNPPMDHGIRYVTLQKMNDNQSFGFVIISSQNKAGATVGKSKNEFFDGFFFLLVQMIFEMNRLKIVLFIKFG